MIIGPLLVEDEINPSTFGPWRDMLRGDRMRGYADGVQAYCPQTAIDSLWWLHESSTESSSVSVADLEYIYRSYPQVRPVLRLPEAYRRQGLIGKATLSERDRSVVRACARRCVSC